MSDSTFTARPGRPSNTNAKFTSQASRLWLDKGSFWENLEPVPLVDNGGAVRFVQQLVWDFKAAKLVIKNHPKILLLPTLFSCVFLLVAIIGITTTAGNYQDAQLKDLRETIASSNLVYERETRFMLKEAISVQQFTEEIRDGLLDGLERAATPLRMVELHAQQHPEYPYMEENFASIAAIIMAVANLPGDAYSLGVSPFGRVAVKYPAAGNEGAIGHDNLMHCQVVPPEKLIMTNAKPGSCQIGGNEFAAACDLPPETACYPSRRYITYLSVKTKELTVDGPVDLVQGGEKFIMRHPIFVDTTGAAYNATFGRGYGPANCTSTECYSEATGVRYWGMSDSLLTFKRWLQLARVEEITSANELAYRIWDPVKNHTLSKSEQEPVDPIQMDVVSHNRVLKLETSPLGGWLKRSNTLRSAEDVDAFVPSWRDPLLAMSIIFTLTLGMSLLLMLVNKKRHQKLLHSMLPVKTLPYIETGRNFCEQFPTVTILFSDIVSYTNLVAGMSPLEVVNMLNDLYFLFDNLVEKHNVYKVETIGDAFMCSAGVPFECSPQHGAASAADMALSMIEATSTFSTSSGVKLRIRVGMHSGPCVGAVIGLKMPHYCLFGDTVNTASRMESNSETMRCHISSSTLQLLVGSENNYHLTPRGEIYIKGKGIMYTYWLDASPEARDNYRVSTGAARVSSQSTGIVEGTFLEEVTVTA